MNRVEPDAADIDFADAVLMDRISGIDWHGVTEQEASQFGLSLGFYRDAVHIKEQRDMAWKTMVMSVISMSAIALVLSFLKADPQYILIAIIATQMVRMMLLYHKALKTKRSVIACEEDVVERAALLAEAHPKKD